MNQNILLNLMYSMPFNVFCDFVKTYLSSNCDQNQILIVARTIDELIVLPDLNNNNKELKL